MLKRIKYFALKHLVYMNIENNKIQKAVTLRTSIEPLDLILGPRILYVLSICWAFYLL